MSIECRHCDGTGTCTTGENGVSCDSCVNKAKEGVFPFWSKTIASSKGLPCGSCQGAGDIEGRAWHLQVTIGPVLGLMIVLFVLAIILLIAVTSPTHHAEILTLLGTLAGSVVGYYFKGTHSPSKPSSQRVPKSKPTPPVPSP
jgi:hypothetical protein